MACGIFVTSFGIFQWGAQTLVVVLRFSWSMACGILVPSPEKEPASPALQGSFLTTGPPKKFQYMFFLNDTFIEIL